MTNEAVLAAPLGVALDAVELESSRRLAWSALLDVTPASELGELVAVVPEEDEGVYTLQYTTRLPGYPDWRWNVSLVRLVDQAEPTVLEAELLPGDGALLAPSWVPWSDRLADYEAAQLLEAGEVVDVDGENAEAAGAEAAPRSSKRIRRTRTRRRIGADGVTEADSSADGSVDDESAQVPASEDVAAGGAGSEPAVGESPEAEKPKKKKRKKEKSAKKAKSDVDTDGAPSDTAAGEAAVEVTDAETPPAEKPKRSRRKRVDQAKPDAVAEETTPDAHGDADGEAAQNKPERRKRKKAGKAVDGESGAGESGADDTSGQEPKAGAIESDDVAQEPSVPKTKRAAKAPAALADEVQPEKSSSRGKRRRVVVVPRSEDELPAQEAAEFGEAADIREFADDMDDVFDGVDFEPDSEVSAPEGDAKS
ncbi:DUF3027 domain-containing protein [Pseudoclavibacter sp. VKM Ac-2888]|uniref:DUF3027 domain-containing protein n=1 Tax=Pseudoclavibacter sp. VKM Ac-2888 TaxID=2783830 RepID=UPI00188A0A1C|nr:DUF3027 domain-containing protein [Pseudoclavibacter sp. VKM Ac-2888]MBF4549988.1 DUF3027 domain-containing protein [Pseudoclavibacter sp. VKM Ac-2888]